MKKIFIAGLFSLITLTMCVSADAEYIYDSYQRPFALILPNNYTNKTLRFPVLYLLHGREQDYSVWQRESVLLTQMNQPNREFIVVLPDSGGNSWYQSAEQINYFRTDLPTYIEQNYRATKVRGIDGLSMGGYGAFHIAGQSDAVYVKDYKSIGSMSGAFVESGDANLLDGVEVDSPNTIAQNVAGKPFRIYMDCGDNDTFEWMGLKYSIKKKNEEMRDLLLGYGRILNENFFFYLPAGEHNWDFWNSRIPFHLDFHAGRFNKYPMLSVTSFPENIISDVSKETERVAGICYHDGAVTALTYKIETANKIIKGTAIGISNWYFDAPLVIGKNNIKINVLTSNDFTTFTRLVLFRRNKTFRIRKVIVKENGVVAKTSDVTYGDIDSLTNGAAGTGFFKIGNIDFEILSNAWKRTGQYVAKYKLNNDDYKFIIKVNGKAQKDFMLLNFKWKNKSLIKTNILNFVNLDSNNLINIQFGFYGDSTNIFLENINDKKGKFKWTGSWFD